MQCFIRVLCLSLMFYPLSVFARQQNEQPVKKHEVRSSKHKAHNQRNTHSSNYDDSDEESEEEDEDPAPKQRRRAKSTTHEGRSHDKRDRYSTSPPHRVEPNVVHPGSSDESVVVVKPGTAEKSSGMGIRDMATIAIAAEILIKSLGHSGDDNSGNSTNDSSTADLAEVAEGG